MHICGFSFDLYTINVFYIYELRIRQDDQMYLVIALLVSVVDCSDASTTGNTRAGERITRK